MGQKIEIDLSDILCDEGYSETLQESIRRQVIENLTKTIKEGIGKKIDEGISKVLNDEMGKAIQIQMPDIINDLLSAEYITVDKWGSRGEKTNFRKELIKSLSQELVYKKTQYSSDKNKFSETVDQVVGENLKLFQQQFITIVNAEFTKEAFEYAAKKLQERLNIK